MKSTKKCGKENNNYSIHRKHQPKIEMLDKKKDYGQIISDRFRIGQFRST